MSATAAMPTRHHVIVGVVDGLGYLRCLHCATDLVAAIEADGTGYPVAVTPAGIDRATEHGPGDRCDGCHGTIWPRDAVHAAELAEAALERVQPAPTQTEREAFLVLADWYWGQA